MLIKNENMHNLLKKNTVLTEISLLFLFVSSFSALDQKTTVIVRILRLDTVKFLKILVMKKRACLSLYNFTFAIIKVKYSKGMWNLFSFILCTVFNYLT